MQKSIVSTQTRLVPSIGAPFAAFLLAALIVAFAMPGACVLAEQSTQAPVPVPEKKLLAEKFDALLMGCGILVMGLALVAMTIIWGRWLRRAVRRKPAPPTTPDPLWYLKTKKGPPLVPPVEGSQGSGPAGTSDRPSP